MSKFDLIKKYRCLINHKYYKKIYMNLGLNEINNNIMVLHL